MALLSRVVMVLALSSCAATAWCAQPALRCEQLAAARIEDVRVESARVEPPGIAWAGAAPASAAAPRRPTPVLRSFCRVQGVIEKEIGFELWLPLNEGDEDGANEVGREGPGGWNGKFLGAGVGGDAGTFNFADLPRGVNRGYASATTDTGHKVADVNWMLGDPQRLKNFELRANHLLAVKAKQLIAAFYTRLPQRSYFIGCSGGGRQGLKEMQRFPADYDGIISGANGPDTPAMTTRRMWEIMQRDQHKDLMSQADWALVAAQGVKRCDALDGVIDGVAEDPRRCRLDLAPLRCTGTASSGCLSLPQLQFARSLYAPLRAPGGRQIDAGLLPGVLVDSGRSQLALGTFGRAIRHRSDWNGEGFEVQRDLAAIDRVMPELRADETDLAPFRARGGKLIMYHGWIDPAVAARMVVSYFERVEHANGGRRATAHFARLYMLPGVLHCSGGPGPDQVGGAGGDAPMMDPQHDMLSALEEWVERGRAPGSLVVAKLQDEKVLRTRRLCPYPQTAKYRGSGSTDDAASFGCTSGGRG